MKMKKSIAILMMVVLVVVVAGTASCNNADIVGGFSDTDVVNKSSFATDTIYQIVTDRFVDGDSSNNPSGEIFDKNDLRKYHGGDWQGIVSKIEDGYFKDLGISAIWISSPVENIMTIDPSNGASSYHGYWAKDFFRTNSAFGTFDDFKKLIEVAHNNGIKIIIDFAPNHTSTAEVDMKCPEDGALYRDGELVSTYSKDDKEIFNHENQTNYSTYENGIYHSLFGLADLNNLNPDVDKYLKEAIDKWIDLGIDGIRVDAVKHNSFGWQKNWVSHIYDKEPLFVFGEWFLGGVRSEKEMTTFTNGSGMSLLDFRFAHAVRNLFSDEKFTMQNFYEMIEESAADYISVNDQVCFIDNHDIARFATVVGEDKKAVDLAHVLLLTSRGTPAIYYGSEQYSTGKEDPENRKDMIKFDKNSPAYKVISHLSKLRKQNKALAYGDTKALLIKDNVIVYERKFGQDVAVVAMNISKTDSIDIESLDTSLKSRDYKDVLEKKLGGVDISVSDGKISKFTLAPQTATVWNCVSDEFTQPLIGDYSPSISNVGKVVTICGAGFGKSKGSVSFGDKEAKVISWSDSIVQIQVPDVDGGFYNIVLQDSKGNKSEPIENFEVLSGKQVPLRIIVNGLEAERGEKVYIVGDIAELGSMNEDNKVGPIFNETKSIATYPSWFYDVNVPENSEIKFKFIKLNPYREVIGESKEYEYTTKDEASTYRIDFE